MSKETITLVLSKDTTQEEVNNIRKEYRDKGYKLNLFICGNENYKENLKELLKAGCC